MFSIYILILVILIVILVALYSVRKLIHFPTSTLFFGIAGVVIGVFIGALLSIPLERLPGIYGTWLPLVITIILSVALAFIFVKQKTKVSHWFLFRFLKQLEEQLGDKTLKVVKESSGKISGIIVDTSVIIDGRIIDILKTGFIDKNLIIPRFVLEELHKISDSRNNLKRNRGRKGLEILEEIKNNREISSEIVEVDFPKLEGVDEKLVKLAKKIKFPILTVDYNLNKVAKIQNVKVLNINELANALKAVVLPGEELSIKVVQEGKEKNQGVGYLPDGTMVVIEEGSKYIGEEIKVEVSRIFQTVAGRMIFAKPLNK